MARPSRSLAERIIETCRRAHWPETHGAPICPRCGDGEDVVSDGDRRHGLRAYRCRAHRYGFSDLTGTPMQGTQLPLLPWALILLLEREGGDMPEAVRACGLNRHTVTAMREKLAASAMAQRWALQLRAARVTAAQLLAEASRAHWERLAANRHRGGGPPKEQTA